MTEIALTPQEVEEADVLLFKARGLISGVIARAGRTRYSHVGLAVICHGHPLCAEVREIYGGRMVSLQRLAANEPGRIDVYRHPNLSWSAQRAITSYMIHLTGKPYGWRRLLKVILLRAPLTRWLITPAMLETYKNDNAPFCSDAVSRAYLYAGVDLVPNLASEMTEPGDLARSGLLHYVGTLYAG